MKGRVIALLAVAGLATVVYLLTGCGVQGTHGSARVTYTPAASPSPGTARATAVATTPSCADQLAGWRSAGALAQVQALSGDMSTYATDVQAIGGDISGGLDATTDEINASTALTSLQGDITAAQQNPAPECVPGLRADYNAALGDMTTAVTTGTAGLSAATSGDLSTAALDLSDSATAMTQASAKFRAATADITAFEGSS